MALRECRAHEEFVAHQAVLKVRLLPANISKRWLRARQQKTLMKILLQSKETRDYVEPGGGWTWKQGRARVFTTGLEAMLFCLDHRICDMQIVCVSHELAKSFNISVTDCRQSH